MKARHWLWVMATFVVADGVAVAEQDDPATIDGLVRESVPNVPAPPDYAWHLLALPERAVEVAFMPMAALVTNVERYRLDQRVSDIFTNEAGTFRVTPKFKFALSDGFGGGAAMTLKRFFGGDERFDISGLARIDGDFALKTRYQQTFARMEGRNVLFFLAYERDQNVPFHGLGNRSLDSDRRDLASTRLDANVNIDLAGLGALRYTGQLHVGFVRDTLEGGKGTRGPVGAVGDTVLPPPGFGQTLNYPRLALDLRFDSRDRGGRPTRGQVIQLQTTLTSDVDNAKQNAVVAKLSINHYQQILPLFRTFVFSAGLAVTQPLTSDGTVPYHELITLGRDSFLRGYQRTRYQDRFGWWGGVQYSFPAAEYMNSNVALNLVLFGDVGRVASKFDELFEKKIRYSYGFGWNVAHTSKSVFNLLFALSPEGFQFTFGGGVEL